MLTLEGLQIELGSFRLTADLSVAAGDTVAIIGPSGAGKSTLLNAIAGFIDPVHGRIVWDGVDMTDQGPDLRPMSIIFQDNNLFPHLSAFDNVGLGLRPSLKLSAQERQQITSALARVGLNGLENHKPAALSGGQKSRVALARVFAQARPLLLLDEPFAALGPALRAEMLDLVAELAAANGATLLMVTHDPDDATRIASKTILVADGTAHPPQPTNELLANPPKSLADYLGI